MNDKTIISRENIKISELAREYREQGYTVYRDPSEFPPFLGGLRPDLVAISNTESDNIVVEVKSRRSVGSDAFLADMAAIVEAQPGWRFEFVMTNPKDIVDDGEEFSDDQARLLLEQASQLAEMGYSTPAMLTAWSATEWALRKILAINGIDTKSKTGLGLARTVTGHGLISKSVYDAVTKASQQRSNLAHGYTILPQDDVLKTTRELVSIAQQLISSITRLTERPDTGETVDELVTWFHEHYVLPVHGVPYDSGEGGYQYVFGGPYEAIDELSSEFPNAEESVIDEAAELINEEGLDWVKIDQY